MKTKICHIAILLLLSTSLFAKKQTETFTVNFNTAQFNLSQEAIKLLDEIYVKTQFKPDFEILVVGHTDDRGSINYNHNLSLNRSNAVKDYFLSKGLKEHFISLDYKGELDPLMNNDNPENWEANRRVEIRLITYQFESIEELEQELSPEMTQTALINPNQDNLIESDRGVKVFVPKHAFKDSQGELVTENVHLEISEALDMKDYIAAGLSTLSNEMLLETGGMIKLTANTSEGEALEMQEGSKITLAIPAEDRQDNMQLFTSTSGSNWDSTGISINNRVRVSAGYPLMRTRTVPFPKFNYKVAKPLEPRPPRQLRKPYEPRTESYFRKIPWYSLQKKKIRAGQQARYDKAVDRYHKRMDRYDRLKVGYDKKQKAYEKDQTLYEMDLRVWKYRKEAALDTFQQTPEYQRAIRKQKAVNQKLLEDYNARLEAWRAQQKEAALEWGKQKDALGLSEGESMESYIFSVSQMNWANVDRFYKMTPSEQKRLVLTTDDADQGKALVLFKSINTIIPCYKSEDEEAFAFDRFPKKEEAFILAYRIVNERPQICFMAIDSRKEYRLEYVDSSFAELKAILDQFEST